MPGAIEITAVYRETERITHRIKQVPALRAPYIHVVDTFSQRNSVHLAYKSAAPGQIAEVSDLRCRGRQAEQALSQRITGQHLNLNAISRSAFGEFSTLSFHAAKVITTVEGGMLFTDDDEIARRARILRNQGEDPDQKYLHVEVGHNYRMTDLHAAIGLVQFRRTDEVLRERPRIADFYNDQFADLQPRIVLTSAPPNGRHGWFFYQILVDDRDEVAAQLKERGVDTRLAWFAPVHKQPIYAHLFSGQSFPVAESLAKRVLNLPIFYGISESELRYVILHVRKVLNNVEEAANVG